MKQGILNHLETLHYNEETGETQNLRYFIYFHLYILTI